jgi:hypothetical protein
MNDSFIRGFGCGAILTAIVALLILGPTIYRLMELQDQQSQSLEKAQKTERIHVSD